METTRIIMTEVISPICKYTKFTVKGSGRLVASVDRRDGKYYIYAGEVITNLQGTRTSKDSAIRFAQKCVLDFIEDAEFKWNVMTERIR